MHCIRNFITVLLLASFGVSLAAQSVRWEPSSGSLAHSQTSELQLVFDGCEPSGNPDIPEVDGLVIQRGGERRSTTIINGRMSQHVAIGYYVRPTQKARLTIPSFTVETDKGRLTVPAASFDVGDATIGGSLSLDSVVKSRFILPDEVWAGQVFPLRQQLTILRRYAYSAPSELDWAPAPFVIEAWDRHQPRESVINGENHVEFLQETRAFLRTPGVATGNTASQLINIIKGTDMWGRHNLDQFSVSTDRPSVSVKPLPSGAPTSFNGAVGEFRLESKVVPESAAVGEPITWTLTLSGTGNWPDIPGLPPREVSRDFRVIQPQAKRAFTDNSLFDAVLTEDVVLVPTKPGNYTIGPASFSYFDPVKGAYQTITAPRTTLTVTAPIAPPPSTSTPPANNTSTETNAAAPTPPAIPALPAGIPRDPLAGYGDAPAPLSQRELILWASAPAVPLLLFWFVLALLRARKTDPFRPRREARVRIGHILSQLKTTSDRERVLTLLQSWQRETAAFWPLSSAVPTADDFRASNDPAGNTWAELWADAERCIYRADTPLPSDWINRAEAALAARTVPGFSPLSLFLPRNLLPFAATIIVGFSAFASDLPAQDAGRAAYDRADFAAAENAWRERLAQTPSDWIAHHNLALTLAQQNRWQDAAAHSVAAFVQHPGDDSVRWHLGLMLEKAGYMPGPLAAFMNPSPLHTLARHYSPTIWQFIIIGGSSVLALAIALALLRRHGARSAMLKYAQWTLVPAGLLLLTFGILCFRVYAPANDARAVIVRKQSTLRSIPTEADTEQKTSPLSAGSLAIVDNTYLGWSRLSFANGQTGWVRHEDVVRLWGTRNH